MASEKLLHIYLNDHLAGATGGVELGKRSATANEGNEFGDFLKRLADELEGDRAALTDLMDALGAPKSPFKQGAGWVAEKLGRLKLNGQLVGYSDLSRLIELEGLAVGVDAKLSLWRTLQALAPADDRLDAARISGLIERAESQREELETYRKRAAALAFEGV